MDRTEIFERHRAHLRGVAYRMLGSVPEAEDAVQETWLRLDRTDTSDVENLGGWLTTVLTRICLNVLRGRDTRREDPLDLVHVPDPVVTIGPEQEAVMADAIGLAMLVVLETLPPAERVAFVLHDTFGLPFEEIAAILDRTPAATRQLASRARRRVREGQVPSGGSDAAEQRRLVDAFFAAARAGDIDGLVAVLDPEVVLRADAGASPVSAVVRGARAVAGRATMFASDDRRLVAADVNGTPGVVVRSGNSVVAVMEFTVADGRIAAIHALADLDRLARLEIPAG
jgi:RNA polymerase sigma-70 factor (ECF subfamily)